MKLLLFFRFLVGIQVDSSHVEPEKRTSKTTAVLSDAVRFGTRRIGGFHLLLFEKNSGHFRFNPVHRGKRFTKYLNLSSAACIYQINIIRAIEHYCLT